MEHWTGVPYVDDATVRGHPFAPVGPTARGGPTVPAGPAAPTNQCADGFMPAQRSSPGDQSPEPVPLAGSSPVADSSPAQEEARLALVAEHTDDAIVIYGPDGRIDWVNNAFVRMSGFSFEEAVGSYRLDLVRGPFTRSGKFAELARDLSERRSASEEFVTRTKDGVTYWVAMDIRPAIRDGRIVGQIGVERDITTRRQAEERARQTLRRAESLSVALRHEKHLLTAVLGTIPHIVWWKNAQLRYVGANQAYLAMRGLSSPAEVVGRLESQLDVDDAMGARLGQWESAVATNHEPIVDSNLSLGRGGEPQHTFLVNVLPYFEEGRFAGVIGIGADVSQVADLERQLAQASRLESIGQLAAGIAHEINTPVQYVSDNTRFVTDTVGDVLTGLREISDLVGDEQVPAQDLRSRLRAVLDRLDLEFVSEEVPSALTQSLEGLDRVGGIVRAMKDFSHPGTGRAHVDLNRVVETTMQVSRNEWKYVADVTLELGPDVGQVPCYEGELKQVLLNIIVNAAQSIAERRKGEGCSEQGHITITTCREEDEALISITDDGIGMDENTRRRVFDPFFTTKDVGKGTGQGMALAHTAIVQKHGGRIAITSVPGEGATFTVALPTNVAVDETGEPDGPTGGQP